MNEDLTTWIQHAVRDERAADLIESPVGGATAAPHFEPCNLWQQCLLASWTDLAQILHRSWTDLGQEGRENQDSQRREEESHKIGPDRP